MGFLFEFLNIDHMNEKTTTCYDCHDCHGFKWKNINISLILTNFVYSPKHFLTRWIVITPSCL
jgi:hypothetical protein